MSDTNPAEITLEQKIKNLEYQLERATNVLVGVNELINKLSNDLDSTQKYINIPAIEKLNRELVETTSRLISGGNKDAELLVKQAYITGKLESLSDLSKRNIETFSNYKTLINQTNIKIQL